MEVLPSSVKKKEWKLFFTPKNKNKKWKLFHTQIPQSKVFRISEGDIYGLRRHSCGDSWCMVIQELFWFFFFFSTWKMLLHLLDRKLHVFKIILLKLIRKNKINFSNKSNDNLGSWKKKKSAVDKHFSMYICQKNILIETWDWVVKVCKFILYDIQWFKFLQTVQNS